MEKETSTEHKKHAKLNQPSFGTFSTNEWAFIGAPCDRIRNIVAGIMEYGRHESSIIYIDESHNKHDKKAIFVNALKQGEEVDFNITLGWNENLLRQQLRPYNFCLINGNHYKGAKQIIILDEAKEESLSRKLDRLTNVRAIITTDHRSLPYDFLKEHIADLSSLPVFEEDDTEGLWNFLKDDFVVPELKALILAGGKSQRMGHDKGRINYHGKEQRIFMYELMEDLVEEVYLSIRDEQENEIEDLQTISDKFMGLGPFGAIVSAFQEDPNAAWIIAPCDLPLLEEDQLEILINNRNPFKFGTAFLNNETGFPEPLISIWEPKMYQHMLAFLAQGYSCPRKVLINSDVKLVEIEDQTFMTNVNTPEEFKEIVSRIKENQ